MNNTLKIGVSSSTLFPDRNGGRPDGMSVYTRNLESGLRRLGQQVSLWTYKTAESQNGAGLNTGFFPHGFSLHSAFSIISGTVLSVKPKVDIFHVTDYKAVRMACPVITTLYDAIPLVHPKMANPHFRNIKNFVLKKSAQSADHVIAISKYSVKEIVEYYQIDPRNISVVPCGVDSSWFTPLLETEVALTLKRRGIHSGYFLFVGIIQPRKNLDNLIKAHNLLPPKIRREHPLVVVGRKGWSCEETIGLLQRKMSLNEAFWFNDVNSEIELKNFYAGAAALVYPSLHEGFGLPLLEAFAIGIPAMISSATSLPEVSAGCALEIDPFDIDGMAHAMMRLLDPVENIDRIKAGKLRARALSWDNSVAKTLEVYNKVLKSP